MSNPRLVRRGEWDGTFSLLLDGEVILERKPLAEIEEAEGFVDVDLIIGMVPPKTNS